MKVTLVPSNVSGPGREHEQFLTSYLINDTVAVDAGSIGLFQGPEEQARIRHVLISHTHLDHLASLPIFLDNVFQPGKAPVTIHASETVLACLQRDVFNDRLWPDFIAISAREPGLLKLATLVHGQTVQIEGLRVTPIAVNHAVPTDGFIIEDDSAAIVIASDTGPTEAIWERANRTPNLKAVFLEASYPNALAELAHRAKHLMPSSLAGEVQKLQKTVAIFAVHIKVRYYAQVAQELGALGLPNLQIAQPGRTYEF